MKMTSLKIRICTIYLAEAIYNFSAEDQEIINNAAVKQAVAQYFKRPTLVPYKRQKIFYWLTYSIMVSVFTAIRHIQIGDITLYGNLPFFPLAFACTDIINELYGVNNVTFITLYTTTIVFLIMWFAVHRHLT